MQDLSENSSTLRRARPYLGTLVEIGVSGESQYECLKAIERAFLEIARVHDALSFYDQQSLLSKFNASLIDEVTEISNDLLPSFVEAFFLYKQSQGVFNPFIDPGTKARTQLKSNPIEFTFNGIRKLLPIQIDLGGIAKGFAVDRAVEILLESNISHGIVNAGGDLRVFGAEPQFIAVRHPKNPAHIAYSLELTNQSLCTSWFHEHPDYQTPGLKSLRVSASLNSPLGVSVMAKNTIYADALAKLFINPQTVDSGLIDRFNAKAIIIE